MYTYENDTIRQYTSITVFGKGNFRNQRLRYIRIKGIESTHQMNEYLTMLKLKNQIDTKDPY